VAKSYIRMQSISRAQQIRHSRALTPPCVLASFRRAGEARLSSSDFQKCRTARKKVFFTRLRVNVMGVLFCPSLHDNKKVLQIMVKNKAIY
jgi:hypothetical protein